MAAAQPKPAAERRLPLEALRDKVEGGWAGQMIGVSYGYPTEFKFLNEIIPEEKLPKWSPEMVKESLKQDDLYVDMTLAKVLDDRGLDAATADFARMFRDAKYPLWHANLAARRNLRRGVPAHLAGAPQYNIHADDIDFQIESDFIGLMTPGLPRAANDIAWRAGRVMNFGEGIYGGMFVACMYAAAYFESDPRKVVEQGLACLPAESRYARVIADTLKWSREQRNWTRTWRLLEDKYNENELCPEGAMRPFNIDAALNGAYIALGLLYGQKDFGKTIEISTRAGQDSDCNPASAAGILGVMLGYRAIPDVWKGGIAAIADEKFSFTDFSFRTIVDSTIRRATAVVERNGGRLEGGALVIKPQAPVPAKLEVWEGRGKVKERVSAGDLRWRWKGEWRTETATVRNIERTTRISTAKGATAELTFNGSGAILSGPLLPTCGKADVYLDDRLQRTVDCYPDEPNRKVTDSLFHVLGLPKGVHTIRVVVRGEPIFDSKGPEVALNDLIVVE